MNSNRQRTSRIAHITDVHVQTERGAPDGFIDCLNHIQCHVYPPAFIINGGDSVMDTISSTFDRAIEQWNEWSRILKEHCKLPIRHCLGNHDLWGTNRKKSGCTGAEPLYAKGLAMERLGLAHAYYSFDFEQWRFIVLDSNYLDESGRFTARLDEKQFEWLAAILAETPLDMHVLIVSHIPILAGASVFFTGHEGEEEPEGDWVVPAQWMHVDARKISGLFSRYPNVRLCVSGHTHLADRMDFRGVTYLNNGAVSGRWWRGDYMNTLPGYALIDLFDDGSFEHQYVPYGWTSETSVP